MIRTAPPTLPPAPAHKSAWQVASPLEIVYQPALLRRVTDYFSVLGEARQAEIAHLVRDQAHALRDWTEEALAAVFARRKTTGLRLHFESPRLLLPKDVEDPTAAMLVVDMGAISLTSVVQKGVGEHSEPLGSDDRPAEHPELYDRYELEVRSLQALLTPMDVDWRSPAVAIERQLHLVYEFGLSVQLHNCILPKGTHKLPQVVVLGGLSEHGARSLNVRLSKAQLGALASIFRSAEQSEGTMTSAPEPRAEVASEPSRGALLVCAHLQLQNCMLMLSDDDERELGMVRTSDIRLDAKRDGELRELNFALGSLLVEDRTQPSSQPAFRLLSSEAASSASVRPKEPAPDAQLVRLCYRSEAGGESELRLHFNRLHIEWNPSTIAALLAFVRVSGDASEAPPPGSVAGAEATGEAAVGEAAGGLKVVAQLAALSVRLNVEQSGVPLALFAMNELGVEVALGRDRGMRVTGQLGNLTAQDTYTSPSRPYEMLGLRAGEQSLLKFDYSSPPEATRAAARAAAACDTSLRLRMSSVRVSYWHPAVMRTVEYLQGGVLGTLVSATASTVAGLARSVLLEGLEEASALALDVEVGSPLVLLPITAGGADGLRADLGRIGVRNALERRAEPDGSEALLDCIAVSCEQMHLSSVGGDGAGGDAGAQMVDDVALAVSVERGIGGSAGRPLMVHGTGGELLCACSKPQYDALLAVLARNLAGGGDSYQDTPGAQTAAGQPAAAAHVTAVQMQVVFAFKLLRLALRSSTLGEPLATVDMRGLHARYTARAETKEVTLGLSSLDVRDETNDGDGARLVNSMRSAGEPQRGEQLASCSYRSEAGGESELRLHFNRLHIEWNPSTIAALLAFVRVSGDASEAPPPGSVAGAEATGEAAVGEAAGGLKVVAQLAALSVRLNVEQSGVPLALFAMNELGVEVALGRDRGMRVTGQLGNLTAQDTYTSPSRPYEMLGLRAGEQSLLKFDYSSPPEATRAAARAAAACDTSLRLRMSSVRVSYWHPAVMRTVEYLQGGVLGTLVSATASTVAGLARSVLLEGLEEASALALDVEVGSPLVLLPITAGGADGLRADLGRIGVRNALERRAEPDGSEALLDCIAVSCEQMHLSSVGGDGAGGDAGAQMVDDVALAVSVERGIGGSAGRPLMVHGTGGELLCACSKPQYDALLAVLARNLGGGGDTAVLRALHEMDLAHPVVHERPAHAQDEEDTHTGVPAAELKVAQPLLRRVAFSLRRTVLQLTDADGPLVSATLNEFGLELRQHAGDETHYTLSCRTLELLNGRAAAAASATASAGGVDGPAPRKRLPQLLCPVSRAGRDSRGSPKSATSARPLPQLHLAYSSEPAERTLVISLQRTRAFVATPVLCALVEFLAAHAASGKEQPPAAFSPQAVRTAMRTATPQSPGISAHKEHVASESRLVVLLSLEGAELLLPRNPDGMNTDGLAMRGTFNLRYLSHCRHEQLDLDVLRLQALVAAADDTAAVTVLAPTDMSFKLSRSRSSLPGGPSDKTEMAFLASQLDCCISYSDCKLINELIAETLQRPAAPKPAGPSPLSSPAPGSSAGAPEAAPSARGSASAARDAPCGSAQLSVALQLDKVRLVAINDLHGRATPLLAVTLADLSSSVSGTVCAKPLDFARLATR